MIGFMPPIRDAGSFTPSYSPYLLVASPDRVATQWNNGSVHTSTKSRTSHIPLDAPTQPRKYPTPSMTSRKTIPARFSKQAKAAQSQRGSSPEDESDELRDESPPLDPNLVEQINDRRRRNAISARNSRRRRLQQMEELEKERDSLLRLVHDYRDYIRALKVNFSNNGISLPDPPLVGPP
ncbi:hypothetical protein F5887DRAFT_962965 [Amanita rubescens]|nr:hypothetical protein F5887DRAFT_962965 [Amanita rubescens]